MKIVAIVQARMSSSRLPGKTLADLNGRPMLVRLVERLRRSKSLQAITVATSNDPTDDPIAALCGDLNVACYRGSLNDVLDRFYQAALFSRATAVVRITADCPLADPGVVDLVVREFLDKGYDYVSNVDPPTFPDGLDTEVFSMSGLERVWKEAILKSDREHVTPYFRKHPELFSQGNIANPEDLSRLRWTVDEPKDLQFVRRIYDRLGNRDFGMQEVADLLMREPELAGINAEIVRNEGYMKSLKQEGSL